jgi:hypothetical protein
MNQDQCIQSVTTDVSNIKYGDPRVSRYTQVRTIDPANTVRNDKTILIISDPL